MSVAQALGRPYVGQREPFKRLLFVLTLMVWTTPSFAQSTATIARPWQIHSFLEDGKFLNKTVTLADVAPDGSLWVAVTDGLYRFDGYRWHRYSEEHGIPSNYVRCVTVTSDGTVWVGTDQGAGVFENERFHVHNTLGNLAGPSVRRIVEDADGSIWFCCDQWPVGGVPGGLTRLKDGKFKTWRSSDGLPSDYISDYLRDSQGRQFVLTNIGLAEMTDSGFREPLREAGLWDEDAYVWSMVDSPTHGLIVSTTEFFFQYRDGEWKRFPNAITTLIQPKLLVTRDGEVFTCSPGRGPTIYQWTDDGFAPTSRRLTDVTGNVEYLLEDSRGAIWIMGFERLLRWGRAVAEWTIHTNVAAPVHTDRADGIWFEKTAASGLVRLGPDNRWSQFPDVSIPLREDPQGRVWAQSTNEVAVFDGGQFQKVDSGDLSAPHLLEIDINGVTWVSATDNNGKPVIAGLDGEDWSVHSLERFENRTFVSHVVRDPRSGVWVVLGAGRFPPFHLIHVTPQQLQETVLPERAQVSNPPRVLAVDDGTLFIGGFFGLMEKPAGAGNWSEITMPSRTLGDIWQLQDETWVSCRGQLGGRSALMRRKNGVWTTFENRTGRFVGRDGDKRIFASSHGQLQIIEAKKQTFAPPIVTSPFETRVSKVIPGWGDELWIGVGSRSYRYVPDDFPPETEIVSGDKRLSASEVLRIRVRGRERFRPSRQRRNYLVSTQIDDEDWSPFEALKNEIQIPNLPLGDHTLKVRVQDAGMQIDPTPAVFRFQVLPVPIQSRPWFKPTIAVGFFLILGLALTSALNWARAYRMARGLEREVKRKTSRLSSSEREYRLLFEDSQDAICLFGNDGLLQSCNSVALELLGFTEDSPPISRLFADGEEETRFQNELQQKTHLRGARYRISGSDQRNFDALLSVNLRTDERGRQNGYQVIVRDISPLVELQRRLLDTEKMEAIGRMAGGIAHDFNNFLAVVMYGAEFVKINAHDHPEIDKGVQMIFEAAERGRILTSQIQTFSRAPTTPLTVIDTQSVLANAPHLLQGVIQPEVTLVCDVADNLGRVRADPHQLEQVLVNLAVNANFAMPKGGTLAIRASNTDLNDSQVAKMRLDEAGPYVRLVVEDSGVGMDGPTRERIFEPFFTTKPQGQGTGLGLAIVYGIIRQFRGQIDVESAPGDGTRFVIHFPICDSEPMQPPTRTVSTDPGSGSETILLVEDESNIRELARGSLEQFGYKVHVASDGAAAKQLIESNGKIDLVISDIVMPGATGFDLLRWLRESRSDIACLLISGYADPTANGELDENVPFLKKPFHPSVLAARVREILDSDLPRNS